MERGRHGISANSLIELYVEALDLKAETSEYAQRLKTFEGRAKECGDFVYNSMQERKLETDTLTVHAVNTYLDLIVASFNQHNYISLHFFP